MTQGPVLSFGARQSMAISPRLQQAIRLLQMSAVDFEQELRAALTSNPFLEDPSDDVDADAAVAAGDVARSDGDEPSFATAALEHPLHESFTERERDGLTASASSSSSTRGEESADSDPGIWATAQMDLRQHLRSQLQASPLHPRERLVAEIVIETLDDNGYLRDDIAGTAEVLEVDPPLSGAEIARGIAIVRGFEPTGVAAHDLPECLSLQLQALPEGTPGRDLALALLTDGLDLLARRDYALLGQRHRCSESQLRDAYGLLRQLEPYPGSRYSAPPAQYVIPDIIVTQVNDELVASINPALRPNARLNQRYVDLLRSCRSSGHPAMAQQLQEARWMLRNAEQRFTTIQRVAEAILRRQREFFVHGDLALKPMVLREVAEEVGLHESTVSRATGNKYMATPRGLFEFKHFFSRQLNTRSGVCSAAAVRAQMQEIIQGEDTREPLSDVTIADLLRHRGIKVARRTVAKYRNMMRVLPAELRRQA